ncbi:hypothetical protein RCH13_001639 [Chryseobacterium sp. MP_3.2]|nr:hypothetical protein [Chryseobacterium sp. MP_3.2]
MIMLYVINGITSTSAKTFFIHQNIKVYKSPESKARKNAVSNFNLIIISKPTKITIPARAIKVPSQKLFRGRYLKKRKEKSLPKSGKDW